MSSYTQEERKILLGIVDQSIQYGLKNGRLLTVEIENYPRKLQELGASFVTLEINGMLRGCIGSLEAYQPLIADVAYNAYAAAFQDPRFLPLREDEYLHLVKHISILTKPVPMYFTSEADLLRQLRPGVDGLTLSDKGRCSTFLPAVWETLPEPKIFLEHLKMKAGLSADYWSNTLCVERYTAEVV